MNALTISSTGQNTRYARIFPVSLALCLFTGEIRSTLDKHFSNQKAPLLLDGDLDIWDSIAMLEYFGEKFPETSPWPDDAKSRGVDRAVSAEMHSSFTALRNQLPMNIIGPCTAAPPGAKMA